MTKETKPSDEELMLAFQRTLDEAAFEKLVSRHLTPALAAASLILADRAQAEDAVQDAFLKVVERRKQFDCSKPFAPWFYTIVRNACRDLLRGAARRTRAEDERAENPPPEAEGAGGDFLDSLDPLDREILILKAVEDMSFNRIAAALDCTVEAAKKRYQRAVARAREALARAGE